MGEKIITKLKPEIRNIFAKNWKQNLFVTFFRKMFFEISEIKMKIDKHISEEVPRYPTFAEMQIDIEKRVPLLAYYCHKHKQLFTPKFFDKTIYNAVTDGVSLRVDHCLFHSISWEQNHDMNERELEECILLPLLPGMWSQDIPNYYDLPNYYYIVTHSWREIDESFQMGFAPAYGVQYNEYRY